MASSVGSRSEFINCWLILWDEWCADPTEEVAQKALLFLNESQNLIGSIGLQDREITIQDSNSNKLYMDLFLKSLDFISLREILKAGPIHLESPYPTEMLSLIADYTVEWRDEIKKLPDCLFTERSFIKNYLQRREENPFAESLALALKAGLDIKKLSLSHGKSFSSLHASLLSRRCSNLENLHIHSCLVHFTALNELTQQIPSLHSITTSSCQYDQLNVTSSDEMNIPALEMLPDLKKPPLREEAVHKNEWAS